MNGERRTAFSGSVFSVCNDFEEANVVLIYKYNRIELQRLTRQYIQSLRLTEIMSKQICDLSFRLDYNRDKIVKSVLKSPVCYRKEKAKLEYEYEKL